MLAAITKVQELAINEPQAKALGTAIANVARHYDTGKINQKTMDWCNLAVCLTLVYTPVVKRVSSGASARRAAKRGQPQSTGVEEPAAPASPAGYDENGFAIVNGVPQVDFGAFQ